MATKEELKKKLDEFTNGKVSAEQFLDEVEKREKTIESSDMIKRGAEDVEIEITDEFVEDLFKRFAEKLEERFKKLENELVQVRSVAEKPVIEKVEEIQEKTPPVQERKIVVRPTLRGTTKTDEEAVASEVGVETIQERIAQFKTKMGKN